MSYKDLLVVLGKLDRQRLAVPRFDHQILAVELIDRAADAGRCAGGRGLGESGPNRQGNEGSNRDFSHHSNPLFPFSRGDSQEVATRTGLSAHIPVNCGVPVARSQSKEWKSFHQRVLLPWSIPRHEQSSSTAERARCAIWALSQRRSPQSQQVDCLIYRGRTE